MSKKNRDKSEFVQVEYEVLDLVSYNGLQLNSHMKLVLASARSYQRTDNVYYESNPTLQLRTGLKEGAVTSLIKKMEVAGLIRIERIKGVGNRYYPLALDLTLAEFIPEKGDIRDILREQSVEQPEPALEPVEREAAEPQEFNQPTEQGPANDRDSQTERQASHDDQNSHDLVEIVKPDVNPDSPADVVPKLKAVPVPAVQGDDEFSIWCSVAERDQLKIPVIDILKGCNGDRDKAAASVKLMIGHTRKRRKEEQQRQIEHLVNEDTSAYSLLDEGEEIPY